MSGRPHWQRWWSIGGAITGLLALAWAFWRVEYDRMLDVLDQSNPNFVLMVAVAFIGAFALWRKSHPATIAPAGSNRSSHGGDEMAEASGVEGHIW